MESNTHLALKAKVKVPQALSFGKKNFQSKKKHERTRKSADHLKCAKNLHQTASPTFDVT